MLDIRNAALMLANDKGILHEVCRGLCAVRMLHVDGDRRRISGDDGLPTPAMTLQPGGQTCDLFGGELLLGTVRPATLPMSDAAGLYGRKRLVTPGNRKGQEENCNEAGEGFHGG